MAPNVPLSPPCPRASRAATCPPSWPACCCRQRPASRPGRSPRSSGSSKACPKPASTASPGGRANLA